MIKAVLFDVGGTLIKPSPSVGEIYSDVLNRFSQSRQPTEINHKFKHSFSNQFEHNQHIDKQWWRTVVQDVFSGNPINQFDEFFEDLYKEFEKPDRWELYPDVLPTLKKLANNGLKLAVSSNWDDRLPSLLEKLDLSPYFLKQYVSYKLNCAKPNPRFFEIIIKDLNITAQEIVHVGDSKKNDLEGAKIAGMHSFLIDRKSKLSRGSVLNSLMDLIKFVEENS